MAKEPDIKDRRPRSGTSRMVCPKCKSAGEFDGPRRQGEGNDYFRCRDCGLVSYLPATADVPNELCASGLQKWPEAEA